MWGAANRDTAVFSNPDELDLGGANACKHMAFGVGVHRCLGAHIARVMFQVMLGQVLTRLPDFELTDAPERFEDAGEVYTVRKLPIRFSPGKPVSISAGTG